MKRPTLKLSYNAPVALTFAILALIALILDGITNGWTTVNLFSVYCSSLSAPLTWVRFFGHVLGHSGYAHYIGNIVLILVLGPNLEDRFGSWNTLWAIVITAVVSGLVQTLDDRPFAICGTAVSRSKRSFSCTSSGIFVTSSRF